MAALFVPGLNLVVGKVVQRITRTLKASTSFPVLYLDKDIVKLPSLTEVAVNVFYGVSDIASESLPQTYSVSTSCMWCNAKECARVLHCQVLDGKFCMDEQDMTFIKTKLSAFMENERGERVRLREKEEKLEKIRKLKEGDPMTVILLRKVLLEMEVNFKASDSKKKLVERVLTERSKANRANNASREHTTDAELIQDQTSTSSDSSSTSLTTLKYSTYFASIPDIPKAAVEPNTNAVVCRNIGNTYFVYFIDYDGKKNFFVIGVSVISFTFNEPL